VALGASNSKDSDNKGKEKKPVDKKKALNDLLL